MSNPTTITKRRDQLKPGDIFRSSHGYRLLVTEVIDTAEVRTDERHVEIRGHLHADPSAPIKNERYAAGLTVEVEVLLWDDAVEAAFEPTDLDKFQAEKAIFEGERKRHEIVDGKLTNPHLIRERAAMAYIEAHEGESAKVSYRDPDRETNWVYTTIGTLSKLYVKVPLFTEDANRTQTMFGVVVGTTVVPLAGVSEMRVEDDRGILIL